VWQREGSKQIDPHNMREATKVKEKEKLTAYERPVRHTYPKITNIGSIRPSRRLNSSLMSPLRRLLSPSPLLIECNASQLFFLDMFW
jgi:hypothetical protein